MKLLDAIIKVYENNGGRAKYEVLYKEIARIQGVRELQYGQKAGVRKLIEDHSSDSENFKGLKDLFKHYGRGEWGLR